MVTLPFSLSRRQARGLLFRLATHLQLVSRGQIAFLFWPDTAEDTARRPLSRLLSYIRSGLPHPDLLQVTSNSRYGNFFGDTSNSVHFRHGFLHFVPISGSFEGNDHTFGQTGNCWQVTNEAIGLNRE